MIKRVLNRVCIIFNTIVVTLLITITIASFVVLCETNKSYDRCMVMIYGEEAID